jgi:DNA processing protein
MWSCHNSSLGIGKNPGWGYAVTRFNADYRRKDVIKDAAYWIALAHLPRWNYLKINSLITKIYIDKSATLEEFFSLDAAGWESEYELGGEDVESLSKAKQEIPNNSFLAESLSNQGYDIIPLVSSEYSRTLKDNLKLTHSPAILYVKGNKQILMEKSIAIVGSRNAAEISIEFTDKIAKLASQNYKVVVSGFAKGVDKAALDSAIKYCGQSIIVLPQGILTFGSGFQKYYKQIINGDVLVLSVFYPKVPWRPELAMARNPIIYGLADEIYVAESSDKGGTWSGVKDGLKKGRVIFVRNPETDEVNANNLLIGLGAIPVDMNGNVVESKVLSENTNLNDINYICNLIDRIISAVSEKALTAKEICVLTGCEWTTRKMSDYLKTLKNVEIVKQGNSNKYRLISAVDTQLSIFSSQ